ncbi:CPBP family intramembrane glutamic endopeptidase [Gimesia sp.]|uniref:CPBP family intramembrane glutamic endopeptidase n=1 Tax=Gimesia sp. TaxID=2024833 RepID=UPI003A8E752A
MVPSALHLLLLLLTLLSIRYWLQFIATRRLSSVFPLYPDRYQLDFSFPVLLAMIWIAMQFASSVEREWSEWHQTLAPANPVTVVQIMQSSLITFCFGAILVLMLVLAHFDVIQKLGFRLNEIRQQLRDGAVGFLLALLPVIALLLLTYPFRSEESLHPFFRLLKAEPYLSTISWIFISAVIVAPLFEELIYRILFQGWLERLLPPFAAILISSLVFSIVHGFPDCIPLFPLAIVLGTLFYYRRSYIAIVVTHSLFNAVNLALALGNQQNSV